MFSGSATEADDGEAGNTQAAADPIQVKYKSQGHMSNCQGHRSNRQGHDGEAWNTQAAADPIQVKYINLKVIGQTIKVICQTIKVIGQTIMVMMEGQETQRQP